MNNNNQFPWKTIIIIVLAIAIIAMLPRVFDKTWGIWQDEKEVVVEKTEEVVVEKTEEVVVEKTEEVVVEKTEEVFEDVKLTLSYSDRDYSYVPQAWEMSFGTIYGIELTTEGFERIDETASTAYFVVPNGYSAIIFVDGLGNNGMGTATFANGETIRFDKGNPTMVGETFFVPEGTSIVIPFEGNDSSGVLIILSKDIELLQEYINYVD